MSSETALFRPAEEILASRDAPPPPAERRAETLNGAAAAVLRGHDELVWSVRFSPDGRRLVSASDDFTVRLWDPAAGVPVLVLPFGRAAAFAAFSPDGDSLAVALFDGTVRVLEAAVP